MRGVQATVQQRNEKAKQLIKSQHELLLAQIEARKTLLQRSAQRKESLRQEIAACDAEVSDLGQQLEEEYTGLVNEHLHSRSGSRRSGDQKQQSNQASEEWFAEDELSFAAQPEEGIYGPLQCRRYAHQVVIRGPEQNIREKSYSCCRKQPFLHVQDWKSHRILKQQNSLKEQHKGNELDVTGIQDDEETDRAAQGEQLLLVDLLPRSKSQLRGSTLDGFLVKKSMGSFQETEYSRLGGLRKTHNNTSGLFSSPSGWGANVKAVDKISFPGVQPQNSQ